MKESRYSKIKEKVKKNRKIIYLIILIMIIIALDQFIKILVINNMYNSSIVVFEGILNLTYTENTGGAYGIGGNSTVMFVIVNLIIITLITKFISMKKDELDTHTLISLGLILAGGTGNLIDRIFRGYVIDYIDVDPLIRFPNFNVADICIVLGCTFILVSLIYNTLKKQEK